PVSPIRRGGSVLLNESLPFPLRHIPEPRPHPHHRQPARVPLRTEKQVHPDRKHHQPRHRRPPPVGGKTPRHRRDQPHRRPQVPRPHFQRHLQRRRQFSDRLRHHPFVRLPPQFHRQQRPPHPIRVHEHRRRDRPRQRRHPPRVPPSRALLLPS